MTGTKETAVYWLWLQKCLGAGAKIADVLRSFDSVRAFWAAEENTYRQSDLFGSLPSFSKKRLPLLLDKSLDDCREMAVNGNKTLSEARTKVEMAGYDRKIALAYCFPEISAKGAYVYNNRNLSLISQDASDALTGTGTKIQDAFQGRLSEVLSDPSVAAALESSAELISSCGFEVEPFGEEEYIIRAVPEDIDASDAENALKEIIGKISSFGLSDPAALKDELLHTVACKAAIKAGWDSSRAELERIADKVVSGEIRYCPHGRPVSTVISRRDLDRMFKRIV